MRTAILFILASFVLAPAVSATTYTVAPDGSGDFLTIQAAIGAAAGGDEIQVEPATYQENLDFLGKNLYLHSTSGPDMTIIDGSNGPADAGSCIVLQSGETVASVVEGFLLRAGHGTNRAPFGVNVGGAILLYYSSLTLRDCRITGCTAYNGAGILFYHGDATISGCTFTTNTATTYGGAISGSNGDIAITDCLFDQNVAQSGDGAVSVAENCTVTVQQCVFSGNQARAGAGLNLGQDSSHATVTGCTFIRNAATGLHGGGLRVHEGWANVDGCLFVENTSILDGGGLILLSGGHAEVTRCTFYGNQAARLGGQAGVYGTLSLNQTILAGGSGPVGGVYAEGAVSVTCCDAWDNEGPDWVGLPDPTGSNGNIALDPYFCDAAGGDFQISSDSPCAPHTPPNPQCDLIGALPVGCGPPTPVQETSWGRIKSGYRR